MVLIWHYLNMTFTPKILNQACFNCLGVNIYKIGVFVKILSIFNIILSRFQ